MHGGIIVGNILSCYAVVKMVEQLFYIINKKGDGLSVYLL